MILFLIINIEIQVSKQMTFLILHENRFPIRHDFSCMDAWKISITSHLTSLLFYTLYHQLMRSFVRVMKIHNLTLVKVFFIASGSLWRLLAKTR